MLRADLSSSTFNFSDEGIAVGPDLEMMSETGMGLVEVIQNDVILSLIAVPPLVCLLEVGKGIVEASVAAFTSSSFSIVPDTGCIIGVSGLRHVVFCDLLEAAMVLDEEAGVDFIEASFFSESECFVVVAFSESSFFLLSLGTFSFLEWSRVFLVAIVNRRTASFRYL